MLVIEEYDKLDCRSRGFFRQLLENSQVGDSPPPPLPGLVVVALPPLLPLPLYGGMSYIQISSALSPGGQHDPQPCDRGVLATLRRARTARRLPT